MKIKLKSIHLRNFRIHEDYTFTPDETGITAIVGANGKGKSSIIDGLAWALYGTRPNSSMKNSSWRRIQASEDDPSYVQADMSINDQNITIKRSIVNAKNGAQQCECFVDGNLIAGPAVSHAEKWITKTIGLDEDSFLSTILVQQKHVDELVSAGQAERRRILERLTGIEAVSRAWQSAKDDAKSYSKTAEMYGVDDDKLTELEAEVQKNDALKRKSEDKLEKLNEKFNKIDDAGRALRRRVDELEQKGRNYRDLKNSESRLSAESSMLSDRLVKLSKRRDDLKKVLPKVIASSEDMEVMQGRLTELNRKLTELRVQLSSCNAAISSKPTDEEVAGAESKRSVLSDSIGKIDYQSLIDKIASINDSIAYDQARIKQSKKSMRELDRDGVTECPTCLQPISDPEHVRKELNGRIDEATHDEESKRGELDDASRQLNDYQNMVNDLKQINDDIKIMRDRIDGAKRSEEQSIIINSDIDSVESEVKSLNQTMRRFDADSVKRDEYERVRDDLADVMGRSSSIDADLNNIRKQLSSVSGGFSEDKLKSLREELDTKRDARGKVNADLAAVKGDIKLYDSNIQSTSRTIDMVKKQIDARKTLLSELEISTSSVEVLGKFRSHMILSSIPQVTDYASDLVMKITDGRFTSIHIDGKFAINVERDDGIVENVSQLSGGEMSLVAICLRLAISVMLSNGSPSLLILDEILTAMDEDRASEILTAMQKLSNGGQIIIVAHNEIIKSIADKVVEL